ncbi:MAG: hypothetical protein HQL99_16475 [Magnetococcales bacterium]|nr:hypothetical protein [Magnetococcales bacterium]
MSPNPFHGGVSRLGVLCRVLDSSTASDGTGTPDLATAKMVGEAMVALLSNAIQSSKVVIERLPENSDALADPGTLVILLHGRIVALRALTGTESRRLLLLSMDLYRHHASDGGRSLFPAAPVVIPLPSGMDGGKADHSERQALHQALASLITATGVAKVSPF